MINQKLSLDSKMRVYGGKVPLPLKAQGSKYSRWLLIHSFTMGNESVTNLQRNRRRLSSWWTSVLKL